MIEHLINQELEGFEQEVHGLLVARGIIANDESIHEEVGKVTKGIAYLSARFNKWWMHLHYGQIDLTKPATSPLNRVMMAFDVSDTILNLPIETAIENGFIAESIENRREAMILSIIWNESIAQLRASDSLRLFPS